MKHRHTPRDCGIVSIHGVPVYNIDSVMTGLVHVHGDVAQGFILSKELSEEPCFVVKGHGFFAHGKTLADARNALEDKIIQNMGVDEKVDIFVKKFKLHESYPVKEFYDWHHNLTGSCEMGRKDFMRQHDISMDGTATTEYFLDITKDSFGSAVIRQIIDRFKEMEKNS